MRAAVEGAARRRDRFIEAGQRGFVPAPDP
jgi:hypothetical protein